MHNSGDWDDIMVHTRPFDLGASNRSLPEVARRQALKGHEEEVYDGNQPDHSQGNPYGPYVPWFDGESQQEESNRGPNDGGEWRVEHLTEIPPSQSSLDSIRCQRLSVLPSATSCYASNSNNSIGSVYKLAQKVSNDY